MSDYVIMPSTDYQAACDAIRTASGETALIKSGDLSSKITKLCDRVGKIPFNKAKNGGYSSVEDITYGGGKFVAVGYRFYKKDDNYVYASKISYSDDGINWTFSTFELSDKLWDSVTYGNGKFVAVGRYYAPYTSSTTYGIVAYSSDGVNWTSSYSTDISRLKCSLVAYANGKFIATNGTKEFMYSSDGVNWTSSSVSDGYELTYIAYGNGKFISVNQDGGIMYSANGISWTNSSTIPTIDGVDPSWKDVIYANGKFIAVGSCYVSGIGWKQSAVAYSNDGVSWTSSKLFDTCSAYSIAYGNDRYIFVGYGGAAYSIDGINWTYFNPCAEYCAGYYWACITYGNGKFLATNSSTIVCCDILGTTFC